MNVLTDEERIAIRQATRPKTTGAWSDSLAYSSAIEAAVIKRLAAGVSAELTSSAQTTGGLRTTGTQKTNSPPPAQQRGCRRTNGA